MKIQHFNRPILINIKEQVIAALGPLGEELGLSFKAGPGEFGGKTANFRIEMLVGKGDPVEFKLQDCWNNSATQLGLDKNLLGKTFKSPMGNITLRGAYPGRSLKPIAVYIGDKESARYMRGTVEWFRGLIELNRPVVAKPPELKVVAKKRAKVKA